MLYYRVMGKTPFHEYFSLALSVFGDLSFVWLFLAALLYPAENVYFIFHTGLLFFLIE